MPDSRCLALVRLMLATMLVSALVAGCSDPYTRDNDPNPGGLGQAPGAPAEVPTLAAPSSSASPTAEPYKPIEITIHADTPTGGDGDTSTCPATVTLSFFLSAPGAPLLSEGRAGLWGNCTDREFQTIDAAGPFDGRTFDLGHGATRYTGTFDGSAATITGGLHATTYVFVVTP